MTRQHRHQYQEIDPEAIEAVRQVYRDLEQIPIQRNCIGRADCCRFALTGQTPFLTRGEAFIAYAAWRKAGGGPLPPSDSQGSCPFLRQGRCRIHQDRPFACRTHFCSAAGGPYPRKSVRHLIQQLEHIDSLLGGSGGENIHTAIARFSRKKRAPGRTSPGLRKK